MRKILAIIFAVILTATATVAAAEGGTESEEEMKITDITYANAAEALERTEPKVFTSKDGSTLNYRVYRSPAYSNNPESAMLFLFLHGSGEKGDDNEAPIKGQKNVVNFLISADAEKVIGDIPYMVIAPQCPAGIITPETPKGSQWVDTAYSAGSYSIDNTPVSKPLALVIEMLDSLVESKAIDKDNIVVSGVSMGGYGAWDLALRRPDLVKSLIPICGGGDPEKASLLVGKRVWMFHCDGDTSVPVEGSRDMVAALEALGADVKYTEFEKAAHNAWWPAATEVSDPSLLEWIMDGIEYKLLLNVSGKGKLTSDATPVKNGGSATVTATPDEGQMLVKLTVNGATVPPEEKDGAYTYTVSDISGVTTVDAVFAPEETEPSEDTSTAKPAAKKKNLLPLWIALGCLAVGTAVYLITKKRSL